MTTPLIYNPAAGGGRGEYRFREVQSIFAIKGIDVEPIRTEHPGHATDLARELAGRKRLFVLGGDGTLSEAANGVLASGKRPQLGFLPAGTGNDFLRDFDILDRKTAADRIALDTVHPVDAARITTLDGEHVAYSMNVFGIGFAADAVAATNSRFKWARGQAYNLGVLSTLAKLSPTPTRLVLDGTERRGDYPMVLVCNTVHTGGAMKMAPMARPDDGHLDVLIASDVNRRELVSLLTKVRKGTHVAHPKVHFVRAKRIELEPERPGPLLVDGELVGETPVRMEVMPGALRVLL